MKLCWVYKLIYWCSLCICGFYLNLPLRLCFFLCSASAIEVVYLPQIIEKHTHTHGSWHEPCWSTDNSLLANQLHRFIMNLQLLSKNAVFFSSFTSSGQLHHQILWPLLSAAWLSDCDSSIPEWQRRDQLAGEAWRALQANAPQQETRTWSLPAASGELPSL